jgi:phosphoserine phosphatase RsbU/P
VRLAENDRRPGEAVDLPDFVRPHPRLHRGIPDIDSLLSGTPPDIADKLRDIQSITDAALSRLDPQALLEVLVDRVKDALGADTSAVLLLDSASRQLVATATSGLEEEVRQSVRIPVGQGFAGRIAAQRQPVIIHEVDHTNVVNPVLLAKGIRSLMGAPLLADGAVIGVLHVGSLTTRTFTSHDVDLLQLAADRAALAVQSLTAQLDRAAATVLQRSLVPTALPAVDGVQMAARYVPGSGNIGGDWYDVFTLPSGQLCAVIGDVAGTGLRAAVIMGRIRSALRAYALETTDPADVLSRLDRKLRHFEPDAMATVLYAVFDSSLEQVRISCAGHLHPIVARPGRPAATAEIAGDVLLGIPVCRPRQVSVLPFPPGALLCLYTDGLVERRGRTIDEGIDRLCAAVAAEEPETACRSVLGAMADDAPSTDDVALLMLRRRPADRQPADPAAADPAAADRTAGGEAGQL